MNPRANNISLSFPERAERILNLIAIVAAIGGAILFLIEYGFHLSGVRAHLFHLLVYIICWFLVAQFFTKFVFASVKKKSLAVNQKDFFLISGFLVTLFLLRTDLLPFDLEKIFVYKVFILLFLGMRASYLNRIFLLFPLSPALTVVTTFVLIIAVGTGLLLLPVATVSGKTTKILDAVFTATSATCVTGLIVVDTGSHFSRFGQIIILLLIQIGGLGLMTFTSFFALLSGEFGVRDRIILREIMRYENLSRIGYLILYILVLTFIFEALGAVLLYLQFLPEAFSSSQALYSAIFHSISAFCNAGFSLNADSFVSYRGNIGINFTMIALIISGGLGFLVIVNLLKMCYSRIKHKRKEPFLLHTKLVLITTLVLLGVGTFLFYLGEMNGSLKNLPFGEKIMASFFQSVTARTAGFNTLKIGSLTTFASFLLMILMFIGASPGSTGGGIKTSTFATLIVTIKSMIQGKDEVEAFKRTIPRTYIYQAICVVTLALSWISISTLILSFTENFSFLDVFFEVFSAFGTVGFSRGITAQLTNWGKIIIIITMLAGRIGPLTLALAIAGKKAVKLYEYPEEGVVIG